MRPIPRFWASQEDTVDTPRGRFRLKMWGWSHTSLAEAAGVARDRIALLVREGGTLPDDQYYPRAPLREEILEEIHGPDGALLGVITRNRYGAAVLNTDAVLIADVDVAEARTRTMSGLLGRLFGRPSTPAASQEDQARAVIQRFAAAHPEWGVQVHRTFGGFRVMVTGTGAGPTNPVAAYILKELSSDPIYVTLCATHETYRARLTPKPWRIGLRAMNDSWPRSPEAQQQAEQWIARYQQLSSGYAVCRREVVLGPPPSPDEALVLSRHDELTRADSALPLA